MHVSVLSAGTNVRVRHGLVPQGVGGTALVIITYF